MSEPKLGIDVVTTAAGDGAKQTAEAIKQVKQAAQETAPAQEELNKKGKESAEATDKVTAAKKGLTEGMRAARAEIPLLGRALDLLKSPFAALGAIISLTTGYVRDLFQKLDAAEAHAQRLANLGAEFGKFQMRALEATLRVREFAADMNEAAAAVQSTAKMLADLNGLMAEQQRLNAERDSFEKASMLAAIEARKDLTPEQKSAEKAKLNTQFEQAAKDRQRQEQWQVAQSMLALSRVEDEKQGDARFQLKGAIQATVAAQSEADKAKVLAGGTQKDFDSRSPEMLKNIRALERQAAAAEEALRNPPGPRHFGGAVPTRAQLERQAEEARQRLAEANKDYDNFVNDNVNAQVNARMAQAKADDALGHEEGLRKTIKESTGRRDELREGAHKLGSSVLRSAAADPNAERSRPPGASMAGASALASAGGKMDEAAGEITQVAVGLNTSISNLQLAIQQMGSGSDMKEVNRKLSQLSRDLGTLKSQFKYHSDMDYP